MDLKQPITMADLPIPRNGKVGESIRKLADEIGSSPHAELLQEMIQTIFRSARPAPEMIQVILALADPPPKSSTSVSGSADPPPK